MKEYEDNEFVPKEEYEKMANCGFYQSIFSGSLDWKIEYMGDKLPGDIKPDEFDIFHLLISNDLITKTGASGF